MRTIFNLALALALALAGGRAAAQEEEQKHGFIRLVNTVSQGTGGLKFLIDGESINPDGYNVGDVTGGIGLKPGSHQIVIRREGVTEGTTRVNVVADETTTMIPFAERVPASDDEPAHWEIRILRLKQQDPETARSATFVSVSSEPEIKIEIREPKGDWTPAYVKRLAVARTPIKYPEGYVPIKTATEELAPIPIGKPGNYVVVLFDNEEGKLQAINLQDYKYLSAD